VYQPIGAQDKNSCMQSGMIFNKQRIIKAPVGDVFQWHARPGALERLSPPREPLEVIADETSA
jgi:ligand-binding SRPBCC domain-containing protein